MQHFARTSALHPAIDWTAAAVLVLVRLWPQSALARPASRQPRARRPSTCTHRGAGICGQGRQHVARCTRVTRRRAQAGRRAREQVDGQDKDRQAEQASRSTDGPVTGQTGGAGEGRQRASRRGSSPQLAPPMRAAPCAPHRRHQRPCHLSPCRLYGSPPSAALRAEPPRYRCRRAGRTARRQGRAAPEWRSLLTLLLSGTRASAARPGPPPPARSPARPPRRSPAARGPACTPRHSTPQPRHSQAHLSNAAPPAALWLSRRVY